MPKIFNIIIVSIIIVVSGFFLVHPKYQEVMLLKNQVAEKKSDIYYKEERLAGLEKLFSQLQQYEQKLRKIDAALPEEPSFPSLFAFLQRTVAENGLVLENISFTPVVSRKKEVPVKRTGVSEEQGSADKEKKTELASEVSALEVQDIYFSFNSNGSYDSLKNFISSLERSSKIWEIISLSISSSDSSGNMGGERSIEEYGDQDEGTQLSANFHIKTHSY
jgi:Tfp pilus assembly protein PilO